MAKQIKIGFDKTPAPITKQFIQLIDIEGTPLFDDAGNPLMTEENAALTSLTISENSLPVHVNNNTAIPNGGEAIPIIEQFKETSQVSSSLLGVPRAETQLSLFSDVATYGLDTENWDASDIYRSHSNDPYQWYQKKHPIHGRRSNVRFYEGSDEQALYLRAFPSQYAYPEGTKEQKREFPSNEFMKYMKFIAMGRYFYNYFLPINKTFAETNFLTATDASIIKQGPDEEVVNAYQFPSGEATVQWENSNEWFDVKYGHVDIQESFDAIERWTAFYDKINLSTDEYPAFPESYIANFQEEIRDAARLNGFKALPDYVKIRQHLSSEDTRPGAGSSETLYGILQSKRSFRYQPGRSSGFTFGARMVAGDPTSQAQIAEWGCSNSTDEYMFQLKGSQFNIIRRSTVRMPDELLTRQGLSVNDQKSTKVTQYGIGNESRLWETVIRRDKFNGDRLLGDGPSGYILSFEDVTMYKIEFSWYGAIGAKFYAYIPVENDEARWVLLHTFVIENGLGEPILENPDFKFKYLIYTNDTKDIREPMYLYKYGSSVYIDGGDEGTIRLATISTESKSFTDRTPILGILPKETLSNSVGEARQNYKKSYPSVVAVTSDVDCRIDFEEIKGSPQGVHFNYSPNIVMSGRNPKTRKVVCRYNTASGGNSGTLTNIELIQPSYSEENAPLVGFTGFNSLPRFDQVVPNFSIDATQGSNIIYANSGGAVKTFDTLQVGDCLYIGGDGIEDDSYKYEIVKFINPRPLQNVQLEGTEGQFSCDARDISVGESFTISGTISGNATIDGYSNPKSYTVSELGDNSGNTSRTLFTLTELNSDPLTTSGTTTTGLTFTTLTSKEYLSANKTGIVLDRNFTSDPAHTSNDNPLPAKLSYQFNPNELNAHVIADGVYGTYVGENGEILKRASIAGDSINSHYQLREDEAVDSRRADGSIFRVDNANLQPSKFFEAHLVGYNTVVASTTGITKNKFKIHFLNRQKREPYSGDDVQHWAEFSVGVTPNRPVAPGEGERPSGDGPEVKFLNPDGSYKEYDINEFPSIEYCHKSTDFDERDRVGLFEQDTSYGNRLQVDPRLDGGGNAYENRIEGADTGMISTVAGEVKTISYTFASVQTANDPDGTSRTKIVFAPGAATPSDGEIIPGFSEVGVNFTGIGHRFTSQVIYPAPGSDDQNPYIFAEIGAFGTLDALVEGQRIVQTKRITLKDDFRATALNESGEQLFNHKRFEITKSVTFSTQPLYPVFALGDYVEINGIVIEEISQQNIVTTHTPTLVTEDTSWNENIAITQQPGVSSGFNPSAFNGSLDLQACRYDETLLNPLRPGRVLYSYYVAANDTTQIELENIFARDRKDISRGALNNKAIYLTATRLNSSDGTGNIQLSLTSKEQ